MSQAQTLLQDVRYCEDAYDCAEMADALVIATEWEQFRALDLERLRDLMACPVVIDLRNIYRPEEMYRHGFAYSSIGRPLASPEIASHEPFARMQSIAKLRARVSNL
jgi:UDPglucose 6-dehydrogenase